MNCREVRTGDRRCVDRPDLPVDSQQRGGTGLKMNVRGPLFDAEPNQLVEIHETPRSRERDEGITLAQSLWISYSFRSSLPSAVGRSRANHFMFNHVDFIGCPNLERSNRESLLPRLERAFEFAAVQVRATIERDPDFFPIYTQKRPLAARRRGLDRLVRRISRRHDVAAGRADRRAGVAAARRALLAPARAQAVRPQRARPGLHLLEYVSSLVSLDRRRPPPRGLDHGRPHARPSLQRTAAAIFARSSRPRASSSTS